ncbi:MAG: pyruvate kinase [Candidatus Omnitrophica bacterium]|nr:pyruvate kinase [Candidatus Omnitrophota bacterium]
MARTKIIGTLGPSSTNATVLRKMYKKGLDIVRLNFSHGTHLEHTERIHMVRSLNKKMRRAVKIMQDLEGYRIRIGRLREPLVLKRNSILSLTQKEVRGTKKEIPFDYQGSLRRIKPGMAIYIDDGRIVLQVKERRGKHLKVQVKNATALLESNKGVNIPEADLDFPPVTDKDKKDVKVALVHELEFVAQSFVRNARDVEEMKGIVKSTRPECKLFAKIESRAALENIDEIIRVSDGIVVARGDLGVCMPIHKVPVIQKEIIKKCRFADIPVVVATQMLDSMIENPFPTRAEVSDIANAILDGATHLLLSAETAVGKYPPKAIEMMNKVIKHTERYEEKLRELML